MVQAFFFFNLPLWIPTKWTKFYRNWIFSKETTYMKIIHPGIYSSIYQHNQLDTQRMKNILFGQLLKIKYT